ncbi:MAG: DNA polymerase III subunit gamma/tau, partial [Actinophytocola sp.]
PPAEPATAPRTEPAAARREVPKTEPAEPTAEPTTEPAAASAGQGRIDAVGIRRAWSAVLEKVREASRSTEAMLTNASVQSVEGDTVTIGHTAAPLARRLAEARNVDAIADALEAVFGGTWHVRCVHADQSGPGAAAAPRPARAEPPTYQRPTQPAPKPAAQPAREQRPTAPPERADEPPLPPEPPDDEDYYSAGGPEPDPPANPEADMVRLLTDRLGARPLET